MINRKKKKSKQVSWSVSKALLKNQFFYWDRNCQPSKKDEHSSATNIGLFSSPFCRSRRLVAFDLISFGNFSSLSLFFFSLSLLSSLNTSGTIERESFAQTRQLATLACLIEERSERICSLSPVHSLGNLHLVFYFSAHLLEYFPFFFSSSALLVPTTYFIRTPISNDKVDANNNLRRGRYSSNFLARKNIRRHLSCEHAAVPSLILDNG